MRHSHIRPTTCLVLALLLAAGNAYPARKPFQSAITELIRAGAQKIFIGEDHRDPNRMTTNSQVLLGAVAGGRHVAYWREMNLPTGELQMLEPLLATFNAGSASPGLREIPAIFFTRQILGSTEAAEEFLGKHKKFSKIMRNGTVSYQPLVFLDPSRRDLGAFLRSRGLAIASLGFTHAIWESVEHHKLKIPYAYSTEIINGIEEMRLREFPQAALTDMYSGYQRALKSGPALFVINTFDNYDYAEELEVMAAWHTKQGFGVLRFTMQSKPIHGLNSETSFYHAMIFAPCELVPVMLRLQAESGEHTTSRMYLNQQSLCQYGKRKTEL